MNLKELVDTVENMILQHDYPGLEARALNLGLPESAVKTSASVFAQALKFENVFVQLAALRWFQERPGIARNHTANVLALLDHKDEWVRFEAIKTLERSSSSEHATVLKISSHLKDEHQMVRQEAAKACGKLLSKSDDKNDVVINMLKEASVDPDKQVRWKAQKALRRLGTYSV